MATVQYITPGREPDLTTEQAAAYLGISPTTLIAWRCTKRHQIQFRKIGRLVRYRQRTGAAVVGKLAGCRLGHGRAARRFNEHPVGLD